MHRKGGESKMATTAFDKIVRSIRSAGGSMQVTSWNQFQTWRKELTKKGGRYAELGNTHQVVLEYGTGVLYLTYHEMAANTTH